MPHAEVAVRAGARVGEGPVWSPEPGLLHWVDILAGDVHTLDPATGAADRLHLPTWVGAVVPRRQGFVAATREGFATVVDGRLETRLALLADGERFNDAKCDSTGRLWAGSNAIDFTAGKGRLHVLEPDWGTRVVLDGLTLPNGLGWSPDDRTFYLVDSEDRVVWAFDFDAATGRIDNRRVLHRFGPPGLPDGLCVDERGYLWIAMWRGSCLTVLTPDGEVADIVPMPVRQPTSCAFGGPDLATLFVTSAREGLDVPAEALDGSLFRLSGLGVTGRPVAGFAG
jgi:sugar lactone lactonase YvrE